MTMPEDPLPKTPVLVVKGAACVTCLKISSELNRCKACKRVFYCSSECQKKDWKRGHKQLCSALSYVNVVDSTTPPRTWDEYRLEIKLLISSLMVFLPGSSHNDERILLYQPHCLKCHRSLFELEKDQKLYICDDCHLIHYCTSCSLSESQHKVDCPKLREVSKADAFQIQHYLETGEPTVQMPTQKPRQTYLPLSQADSWYDYYTQISDKGMASGLLSPDLKPIAGNEEMACAMRAATERSSIMLTIIAALEATLPDLNTKTKINLDLIGTDHMELEALMLFEEMMHLLPALKILHCSFVGLELPKPVGTDEKLVLDCCEDCTKAGRTRSIDMFKGAYHDFINTEKYSKPDLAVALQTGHADSDVEAWTPTIKYLAKIANHATVFTTWNEKEMQDETKILKNLDTKFVVEGEENKWRGMRPMLEIMEEKENSIYYHHYYWYIIAGQGS